MIICPIKIESNDCLPKKICEECLDIVLKAYKLRNISSDSERYLKSLEEELQEVSIDGLIEHKSGENIEKQSEKLNTPLDECDENNPEFSYEVKSALNFIEDDSKDAYIVYEASLESDLNEVEMEVIEDEKQKEPESNHQVDEENTTELMPGYVFAYVDDEGIAEENTNFKYKVLCLDKEKKSSVWRYFGFLIDENGTSVESEKDYYFCKICVEQNHSFKPKYRVDVTATSNLFSHMKRLHNIMKKDMIEIEEEKFNTIQHVQDIEFCDLCEKSYTAPSLQMHKSLEHENGELLRNRNQNLQYKVNCFKASSKSLAWEYFGALENERGDTLDEYHFYCRLCVEEEFKLTPKYTKNTSTSILLMHIKNTHIPKSEENEKPKSLIPIIFPKNKCDDFECHVCSLKHDSKKSLTRHLTRDHREDLKLFCQFPDCTSSFGTRDSLLKHMKRIHSGERFPCHQCPSILSTRLSLRRHIDACHLKKQPFVCDGCGAKYTELKSLKKHIQKVHLGIDEKRIPCDLCTLHFPNLWSLRRHLLTHTGEKPHKCHFCSQSYASKGDLAKHLTKIHDAKVYECEFSGCSQGFRLKSELRDHYKIHYEVDEDDVDEIMINPDSYEIISEEIID
ncbi:CLUMA_CG008483, isoform A [Clunio marinus]|uniref:CLUMA_CG008483, isoform A n=1 Tax=Clunio marinus TaxID=568069 RepID=A0A1J1I3X3_9DIPT|nr:CLUMA_CG008483, isoform A [Clunio marinus]